ncbi:filamentous hemagglutinin N-terminal domain-containing protein [Polynucleobacter paneuropaeus]|nr:filamentous hemagglutinin N-terminal domain-containing protein [Polynucleobacter paneuropaeus]MBT8612747.1 filamentous hemagglutinin N-terminal domain-containing protein [Polynucleobacter paneuropaeus]QWD42895.1 filamentous hemagglutinin N-terminal domain-containing protein [Polynucleobacter paneuropaeus]
MERSLLSSNHPEKQFDVKLPMAGKVFALVCLFALSTQFALAQNKIAVNALPTGGNVVAGAATISSTSTAKSATMNINQTSQRAVINWQTFNVGKNATVNFNQPNSGSVTLNRVVSATPSMIQGAINANGQVILVNPNGVTFGKGAQVNAAGVVASTLNISNQDFMNGKNIYSGNGEGKIVNKGTITATDPNGYIALLAPEIRNQGYLIARMGPSSTVALASGEKISLDFRGTQLIGVSIDKAAYKALIENKRIIETNGGVIIVAAGTARELMSSVIQNTGRISANSIVDNGGVIELVADNVTNSGSISANGGTNGVGGQVNIVGNNITLAANSQTTATGNLGGGSIQVGVGKTVATNTTPASAVNGNANTAAAPQTAAQILASNTQGVGTQAQTVSVEQGAVVDASAINSGNGGAIVIWSQVKTTVNGILKAVGGYLNGNGGLIETSSAGLVSLGKSLSIDTSSSKGSAGLWYVDPIDLTIDGASSAVISAALVNNNVSITVAGNTCPSLGSCTQNGSGNLTIASGADIIKQSGSLTTLTLTASGVFNLNANISGQNLDVIINSSIAYLNARSTITANQVTVQAQTIYSYGNINSGSLSNLGSAIQLLGSALYISGNLTVGANLANSSNSTSSNSNTVSYNGTLIRQEDLPTYLAAANQTTLNLDQVYATTAANQASFTTAVNNQITLTGTESISIAATAQLLANGTTGGVIMATAPQINLVTTSNSSPSSGSQSIQGNGSLIQANGNNGPGGTISFTAANDFNINVATISASGSTDGGSIRLISSGGNLLMANSLIQTNGGTGRGGSLGVSGANSTTINSSTLEATGFSKGGSIMVGYDSAGKSIPFSQSTTIDAASILSANQTDSTNTTGGGLIETSGGTLTQLASINAGRGGMWLLDPITYSIDGSEASAITSVLNTGTSVIISTSINPLVINGVSLSPVSASSDAIYINSAIQTTLTSYASLTFSASTIYIGANISTNGPQTYNGNVQIVGSISLSTNGGNLTVNNGVISGSNGANTAISLLGGDAYYGSYIVSTPSANYGGSIAKNSNSGSSVPGGVLTYLGLVNNSDGTFSSSYTWAPNVTVSSGSTLVVGAGGGGGAAWAQNGGSPGGGGSGGAVNSYNQSYSSGYTYSILVGIGGLGGNGSYGLAGGGSSISMVGVGLISAAAGGAGGAIGFSTTGGSALAGNGPAKSQWPATDSANGQPGISSSITGTSIIYGSGGATNSATTSVGITSDTSNNKYGYGGTQSNPNGNNGQPNTGMGGGAGFNATPNNPGLGGNGANGIVVITTMGTSSTLNLSNVGQISIGAINGSGSNQSTLSIVGISINGSNHYGNITGPISGTVSFNIDSYAGFNGAGNILKISGNNSFTGTFTIYGGIVQVGSNNAFGDPTNHITVAQSSSTDLPTLDLNGFSLPAYYLMIQGVGSGSNGALINSNLGQVATFAGYVALNSTAYVGGPGALNLTGVVNDMFAIGFVNGATVTALNPQNSIGMIGGYGSGAITLVTGNNGLISGMSVVQMDGHINGFFNSTGNINLIGVGGASVSAIAPITTTGNITFTGSTYGGGVAVSSTLTSNGGSIVLNGASGVCVSCNWGGAGVIFYSGGQLITTSAVNGNGNISINGSSANTSDGYGVYFGQGNAGTPIIISAANNLTVAGYAAGGPLFRQYSPAGMGTGGAYGIVNDGPVLLRANGNIILAASTPNGAATNGGSGYAIHLTGAAINAGGALNIGGAITSTVTTVDGSQFSNIAQPLIGSSANGGSQFGVYIAQSIPITFNASSYSDIVAGSNIWIAGTTGASSFATNGLNIGSSITSKNGTITLIGVSSGNRANGVVLNNSAKIQTQNTLSGDILVEGSNPGSQGGYGIFLDTAAVVDSANSLTLVGFSAGANTGGVFGIASSLNSNTLLKSAGNMTLAASAPNVMAFVAGGEPDYNYGTLTSGFSTSGAAIDITSALYSGGTLTVNGALLSSSGSISYKATNNPGSMASSLASGVAISNNGVNVSYLGSTYSGTYANGAINIAGSSTGAPGVGVYIAGNITSNNGSISIIGKAEGASNDTNNSGIEIDGNHSASGISIKTLNKSDGNINMTGYTTSNGYGSGIWFTNGPSSGPVVVDAANQLTLIGFSNGVGDAWNSATAISINNRFNVGVGNGLLRSGGDMIIAASAPKSQFGTALWSRYAIYSSGALSIVGVDMSSGTPVISSGFPAVTSAANAVYLSAAPTPIIYNDVSYNSTVAKNDVNISGLSTGAFSAVSIDSITSVNANIVINGGSLYDSSGASNAIYLGTVNAARSVQLQAINGGTLLAANITGIDVNLVSNGNLRVYGAIIANGSTGSGISIHANGDVSLGALTNSGSSGINVMSGESVPAGLTTGGTITSLGLVTNTAGVVGLSMAAPENNACQTGCNIEQAIGITSSNASIATNIQYGVAGGVLSHPTGYTGGNFINYRKTASVGYAVSLGNNYSAVYGTAYNSTTANAWLLSNATVALTGTAFGYTVGAAAANLRFNDSVGLTKNANIVQSSTPINSQSLSSTDGSEITLVGTARTYSITPAALTITAGNDNKLYGATTTTTSGTTYVNGVASNSGYFTVSGLVTNFPNVVGISNTGDSVATVTLTSNGGLATATVNGGPYAIVPSAASGSGLSNYTINYVNGAMNVTPAPLSVTAYNDSKVYGTTTTALRNITYTSVGTGANATGAATTTTGYSVAGLLNSDSVTGVTLSSNGGLATATVAGGPYAITPGAATGSGLSNYAIQYVNAVMQMTPASLTITASNDSKVYGATATSNNIGSYANGSITAIGSGFTVNGLLNSDSISRVILTSNGALATATVAGGPYSITPSTPTGVGLSNYSINYVNGSMSVTPAPLGISVTGVYNNSTTFAPSSFTTYGLVNGEVINTLSSATVAFKDVLTGNNYVTSAAIGTGTASLSNYQLNPLGRVITPNSTLQNMVTITPLAITVTGAVANNKVYDGTTAAIVNSSNATLNGKLSGDDLTLTMTSGSFMSPDVGTSISVSGAGSLQGSSASNYTLGATILMANITKAPLGVTVTGTYSNSTTITPTSFTTNGLVNGETIVTLTSAIVSNKNVAANGSNYVTSITKGNGTATLNNYAINTSYNASSGNTQNTATIDPKVLSVSGTAVADKVYNGTASATLTNGVLNGVNPGDSITLTQAGEFSQANVGTSITVVARDAISDSSGNYTLQQPQTLNASITPKLVTLSATKTYDATTSLTGVVTIGGLVGSETLNYTGATAYSVNAGGVNFIAAMTLANGSNGGLASNYVLPSLGTFANAPVTITPKSLTVSGTTVANKVYDSTGDATLSGGSLVGLVTGDAAYVSLVQAGTFAQSNVGSAIAVTANNSLTGTKASNYALTQPTGLGADITPKPLGITVTGTYNGTNTIEVTSFTTTGLVAGEVMGSILSATVSDANVATPNKYVGSIAYITGNGARVLWMSNYSISQAYNSTVGSTQNIATITPIALTVTGTTVPNKVYDGSTATTLANGVLNGVINGQTVGLVQAGTFASPNAGSNVAVVANDSLSGNAAVLSNYTLVQPTTTTGNITPAPVTVNNTSVANKVYDGTNVATLTGGTLSGMIAGDAVNVTLNQSGTFASVNVGSGIAVTATDSLSGTKALNYVITQPIVSAANITAKNLTVSGTTVSGKTYDGTNTATLLTGVLVGVVGSENVTLTQAGTFTSINAGTGIAVNAGDSISGPAASNYTLSQPTGLIGTITPKALTVTGTTVPDKVYDGSTTTTLANGVLVGVVAKDVSSVTLNQSGTFASPNAGTNVAVVANDSLSLTAGAVGNYTLTQPTTTTGNIIKAPLGVTVNGIYSGGVLAPTAFTTNGLLNGETITALSSATPHDPNVATTSNYVSAITISGGTASMNNYALTQAYNASVGNTQNTVTITPKAVTLTGTKVYDGTLTGAVNGGTLTIGGLVGSQTLNYSGVTVNDANVGTNKYITAITLADGSLGGIASNYALPSLAAASSNNTATITPAPLGITASAVYNGTTFFLNPSAFTTTGLMNGETITVLSSVTLNNANVASNGSNYVVSAYILTGTASLSNYSLTNRYNISSGSTQNSAVITPAPVTVNGTNIANKVYDGSVVAGLTGGTLSGVIAADIALVSLNQSGNFASANIGTGIAVIATDSLSGTKATNYALTQPTALSANITAKNLTVTGTTVSAKTYDGTNVATLLTGNLVGVVNGESVTLTQAGIFSSANAGVGLVVTASDVIGGAAAANYTLTQPTGLTGTINPKALTVTSVTASNKVYDGLTSVTFSNAAGLVGVIGSDNVILAQAGSFASKNVGTGIAVTTNNTISGTAAANYTLVQPTGITANITPAPLGVTVTGVYSGSTTVTPTSFTTTGLQGSDTITALSSANFSNANVSANSSNYVTAVTIGSGTASMSNYAITQAYNATPGNTLNTATITPKALTLSASKVYDGSTTGASVNISGLIGGQTLNYSDVRLSDQNVATANKYISAITLADGAGGGIASNYVPPSLSAASASNSVTITPLMVRLSANKEYDGTTSLTGKVTISGLVGSETLNYTGATAISPNVGANYINAIALADGTNGGLASNYQIPNLTLAYTNNNAQVTAKAISISATKVYDATADLTNAITITGLIGNQTLNYSGATANSANVLGASYINAITFTDGANGGLERNYIVPTLTGSNTNNSVSITAAPLSLSGTKIYDGSRTGGTGTLNIGGLIGTQTLSSSDVKVNDPNVGTDKYITAITLADGANGGITSNYALPNLTVASARNNGSITPRDLTITVSAQTKTYGDGIAQTSNTQDGSINLTPVSGHTSGTASNVDTRTTALSDIQYVNYTGNTANNSTAGFSVDGLVANDVVRTVNISSSGGALTANANVNGVLAYAITASGAVGTGLSNYNISYVANNYSVLTITPRKLVVTAATATMVYGASALPTLSTSSITGWANTADQAITSIALSAQDATGKLVKANIGGVTGSPVVGTYSVVATGVNGNPNYVIDTVNSTPGQFTITPASLTITANSLGGPGAPILYGTPTVLKPDAFTSSGLTNGDSLSTATITFNSATTVAGTTTPGIYTPVVSGPSSTGGLQISGASGPTFVASNYVINYVAGSLTIGQAKLTVSAVNDAKLQGQQDANGYNGVIVSGFVNGDTLSVLNTTGLSITRNNAVNNTAPGTYNGVLIASGVSLADLNSTNYSIAYQPGNFTIVPPNQLLIKVAPVTTQYGSAIYASSSPVTATYVTSSSCATISCVQSINASISGSGTNYTVNLYSTGSTANIPLNIGAAADISSSGNLNVGSYNVSPTAQQINLQGTGLTSAVAVGGISITPKTLSFADLGSVTLTKDYDGKASSTVPVPALSSTFLSGDNVTATASGTFTNLITGMPDANAGINKSYTIAVSFSPKLTTPGANQTDANNYVLTGGGIYTADGGTGINHGPANGVINVLDSVTYIGAASGAAWSSASSWVNGAVPTYANVRNVIVPVGFSVVYDSGVAGPVTANLQNAGNVNFNTDMGLAISMNISGAGSITISGTGQVSLSGNNTYTGNAIINNGAKLVATYGNTIGVGNIQGLGGTFQTTPGTIFTQINATGSLILASDITTTGNQTYGNITFSQPRTTLLSQFGSITINGTVDSGTANVNTLLLQAPTGSVSLRGSVGSIKPLNVLEIDAVSTYLYADVLTADQQNYCGAAGCYTAITPAQVTASYCATNDCYSKNNDTSAYNLLASGTGGSGNFAKSANIGQLFIGDVGQVGFLYNKYNQYASKSVADGGFGTPTPLFNNNSVYARTLMSMDPTVNLGSYVSDVSVTPTHTIQVAAIQATGVTASPTIQMSGSGKTQSTSALYSLSALTQGATWAGTYSDSAPIEAANYIALGSKALNLNNASLTAPTLNLVYPPSGTLTTNASSSFTANNASINGRATTTIGGRSLTPYTPATPSPSGVTGARSLATPATPTTRNSFILAAVAEQTKIERKYDVDASVDVGEIETDDGPAAADDQDDKKKKKAGNQKSAQ